MSEQETKQAKGHHKPHEPKTVADKVIGGTNDVQSVASKGVATVSGAQKLDIAKLEPVLKQRLGNEQAEKVVAELKQVKQLASKADPEMLKDLGKNLSRAGLVVTVAEGINDVSKEKGAGHKAQRATAVFVEDAVKVTPGILASEGAVTMAGGIVETGGLIVVPAVAGALIKLDADTIIDGKRLYEKADNASQPDKAHSNLIGQERELASTLKDMGVTYDKKGNVDLTVGSNRQKLQRALHDTHDKLAHVIESNDGLLLRDAPLWRGKQLTNFNEAKIELGSVDAAIADLGEVRAQMAANKHAKAQHVKADDTVTHGLHKQPQIKQENAGIAKA